MQCSLLIIIIMIISSLPLHLKRLSIMAHNWLTLSHHHSINLPDVRYAEGTYYLEIVHLEESAAMNILGFHYILSKWSLSKNRC